MAGTITWKTQGKAKETPKDPSPQETKNEEKRASPSCGRKLSHPHPF
jgi:hypothetical protein